MFLLLLSDAEFDAVVVLRHFLEVYQSNTHEVANVKDMCCC